MTIREYYVSDVLELDASVLACEQVGSDRRWSILLDKTIFHPRGGGQLADEGWINGRAVLGVENDGEVIRHIVSEPLSQGVVQLKLNAQTRSLHARLHSAGHLIGNVGISFGMVPIKAQHWPAAASVSFQCEDGQVPGMDEMGQFVQLLIDQDLVRTCQVNKGVRTVRFGELASFPCGGTHVKNLAEIGVVRLLAMRRKKGVVTISYDIF